MLKKFFASSDRKCLFLKFNICTFSLNGLNFLKHGTDLSEIFLVVSAFFLMLLQ